MLMLVRSAISERLCDNVRMLMFMLLLTTSGA
jgi:hypothetical protein